MRHGRQRCLGEVAADAEQSEGAFLRRLGDQRIAGGKRAGAFVGPEFDRIIERHDRDHDAARHPRGECDAVFQSRNGVERRNAAEHPLGFLGIAAEDPDGCGDLAADFAAGLAVLARQQGRKVLGVALDTRRNGHQCVMANMGWCARHRFAALLGELNGGERVGFACGRHGVDQFPGRGVADFHHRAIGRIAPFAADQHLHTRLPQHAICHIVAPSKKLNNIYC
jgi:hypothetical protein